MDDSTRAAETRALLAHTKQRMIAELLYHVDTFEQRQKGATPPTFYETGPRTHAEYFEKARTFIRAGVLVSRDTPNATPLEELP